MAMITKRITYLFLISLLLLSANAFSQKVPTSTGSKVSQEDAQAALDFHNKARNDVGSPPLEWSKDLAKYAQAWADQLAKEGCQLKHRPHEGAWKQIHG